MSPRTSLQSTADPVCLLKPPTFVGRAAELDAVGACVERARRGEGGLLLIDGGAGSGKSWLLEAAARRFDGAAWVLRGSALDHVAHRPFELFERVVDRVCQRARSEEPFAQRLSSRLGESLGAACEALPQLRPALGVDDVSPAAPEAGGQARATAAACALLDALGDAQRPALILLDDLQWGDELGSGLLAWFAAHAPAQRFVCIVGVYRSEELAQQHALRGVASAERRPLGALSDEEVCALAASMADGLPASAAQVAAQMAQGSPLMAAAALQGLQDGGALVCENGAWRVDEAVLAQSRAEPQGALLLRRLERLAPQVEALLKVGAVLGRDFELDLAAALASQTLEVARNAIQKAQARHIVEFGTGARCVFGDDRIREALLARLGPSDRAELHGRAAVHLAVRGPERAADVAFHFEQAGRPEDGFPYAVSAARLARGQFAYESAASSYRMALRGIRAGDRLMRQRVSEELGEVLMLSGHYDEAEPNLRQALELAQGDVHRARVQGKLGELLFKKGQMRAASATLQEGLALLGRRAPRTLLGFLFGVVRAVLVHLWHCLFPGALGGRSLSSGERDLLAAHLYGRFGYTTWFFRGTLPTAWAMFNQLNLAEHYPPNPELRQALTNYGTGMSGIPWPSRGTAYHERGLAMARAIGDRWGEGQALHFYGVLLYSSSRYEAAVEKCSQAAASLGRLGDQWEENDARLNHALALYRLGRLGEAIALAKAIHRDALAMGDHHSTTISLEVWSKASEGRVPADLLATELARTMDDVQSYTEAMQGEAVRLLREGSAAAAVEVLGRAGRMAARSMLWLEYVAPIPAWLATAVRAAYEQAPQSDPARERLLKRGRRAAWLASLMAWFFTNNRPHALREKGLWALIAGRPEAARKLLERSLAVAQSQGARFERALTLEAYASAGEARGWAQAKERGDEARTELAAMRAERV